PADLRAPLRRERHRSHDYPRRDDAHDACCDRCGCRPRSPRIARGPDGHAEKRIMTNAKLVAYSSLAIVAALYVGGAVSVPAGALRHEVQTLPLWFPIIAGLENRELAKWAALPCLIFWLTVMIFIWLFLLGWAQIVTGHFLPTEIAMTLVVG